MTLKSLVFVGLTAGLLAGCEPGANTDAVTTDPLPGAEGTDAASAASDAPDAAQTAAPATSVRLVDRDVEAPKDFQTTDKALWDGRPSLGGVWVAASNVKDPMRVIMRNPANGKFVIGALFRREADNPGPKLQISSDAADALGMQAGEPATINVTALRREEVAAPTPDASRPLLDTSETVAAEGAAEAEATAAAALAAVSTDSPATEPAGAAPAVPVAPAAAPKPAKPAKPAKGAPMNALEPAADPAAAVAATMPAPAAGGGGVTVQIGIFSVEANAKRAVSTLAKAGVTATIRPETSLGKPLWSVVASGGGDVLAKIKKAGFADAYVLKR